MFADLPKNRDGPSRRFLGPHIFDKCFLAGPSYFPLAHRRLRGEERGARCKPCRAASLSHLICGACARPFGAAQIPTTDEAGVSGIGSFDPSTLLIAMALDIVGAAGAFLAAVGFVPRLQFQIAQLLGVQRGPGPCIAFALTPR